jgi:hypothetical protein
MTVPSQAQLRSKHVAKINDGSMAVTDQPVLIVLDTMIVVGGATDHTTGADAKVLHLIETGGVRLASSDAWLRELQDVLTRPVILESVGDPGRLVRAALRSSMMCFTGATDGGRSSSTSPMRQVQAFADQENAHGWTVVSDYCATGEGCHVYSLRSFTSSEAQARDHFRARSDFRS